MFFFRDKKWNWVIRLNLLVPGSYLRTISALWILYSARIVLTSSRSSSDWGTMLCMFIPPLSFFLKIMFGGVLLRRIPNPSSSCSRIFLCPSGLRTSRTIKIRFAVLATAITCRPLPFPSLAPSIIPGKSRSWILAPCRTNN